LPGLAEIAASAPVHAFAAAVAGLIGRPLGDERFAVAVSGGPDSLALLSLACAAFGTQVVALTVDHGLRPAAAAEAAAVADHAAGLGVTHVILRWDGPKPTANLQAAARAARYRLLTAWCAANGVRWLATAHHRDDQAETLLLRLARGAAVGGLSGIRRVRDLGHGVTLLRPLLDAAKADLAAVVAAAGWTAVDDPANRAVRFDRTHARALLATRPWLDPARLAASADALAAAEAALAWTAERAWAGRVMVTERAVTVDAAGLPDELTRRLLVRAVTLLAPSAVLRGEAVTRLMGRLAAGSGATVAGVAVRPVSVGPTTVWRFTAAPPRRKP